MDMAAGASSVPDIWAHAAGKDIKPGWRRTSQKDIKPGWRSGRLIWHQLHTAGSCAQWSPRSPQAGSRPQETEPGRGTQKGWGRVAPWGTLRTPGTGEERAECEWGQFRARLQQQPAAWGQAALLSFVLLFLLGGRGAVGRKEDL